MTVISPIGVLTRNRVLYLDSTLRSLSATHLPAEQPLLVFDDASDDVATRRYLYDRELVPCGTLPWPQNDAWRQLGLSVLNDYYATPRGLSARIQVERLGELPLGVVNGSCRMICRLFALYPQAPGIFLLQDDVIFNADWHMRMQLALGDTQHGQIGLLSGCRLNKQLKPPVARHGLLRLSHSTTAQCVFLRRSAFEKAQGWFEAKHRISSGFDNHLCMAVRNSGHVVCLVNPAVCQHIGMLSLVRPKLGWQARGKRGRISYEARPPYVLASAIKTFSPCR